jgi:hypothetical protein
MNHNFFNSSGNHFPNKKRQKNEFILENLEYLEKIEI